MLLEHTRSQLFLSARGQLGLVWGEERGLAAQEGLPGAAAWTCEPRSLSGEVGGGRSRGVERKQGRPCSEEAEHSRGAWRRVLGGCADMERMGCRAGGPRV